MEHQIDMGAWRQNCDERLNKLKADEKIKQVKAEAVLLVPTKQEKSLGAKEILDPQLCKAIRDKDVELFLSTLEKLCREKLYVLEIMGQATRSGDTLLHLAAYADNREILELIADHFPKLLTRRSTIKGDTVLHIAARTRKSKLIETILECFARHSSSDKEERICKMEDEYGNTALHYAVMARDVDGASLLFSADEGVVHKLNKEGKSPLYLAVESRELHIIKLLLRAPFHNVVWHRGNSPLHAAILGTNKSDVVSGPRGRRSLGEEIKASKAVLVTLLLTERPELIHLRDQKGDSPLHWAASIGLLKCVGIFLKRDSQSTLEWNAKGLLAVHVACQRGDVGVVKKIIEQEWLDPRDLLSRKGQNILHIAAKNGKDKVVSYILRHKRQLGEEMLNDRDKNGNTPLHLASKYSYPKVLQLLTKEGRADFDFGNNQGLTALDILSLRAEFPWFVREAHNILISAGATHSDKIYEMAENKIIPPPNMKWFRDRIEALMLVAILVATVTFAAGFTMPGGYNGSDDPDSNRRGMATLLNRKMFQLYTICDTVAMYSSTISSFILLWAQLGDVYIAQSVSILALYLVGLALITMSIAFMAAVHLVVSNLSWLAYSIMIIAIMFLLVFLTAFIFLRFPIGTGNRLLRPISNLLIRILIPFSGSDRRLRKKDKKKVAEEKSASDEDKDETPHKFSTDVTEHQKTS